MPRRPALITRRGDQPSDRDALVALYCATGGASWSNKTNWLSSAALISWHGVEATTDNTVTRINLTQNNLTGTIPSELGNLSNLKRLDFRVNNLTGTIPPELGDLDSLLDLWLSSNDLTGTIPSELGNLGSLLALSLSKNDLDGTIPPELGDLDSLQFLLLSQNQLTGTIPSELGNLGSLLQLYLDDNDLDGTIPSELGELGSLKNLVLASNKLTGTIPSELGSLNSLQRLQLDDNDLDGTIPPELGDLSGLQRLYLHGNDLTGTIPSKLGDLSGLQLLILSRNDLKGAIPSQLGNLNSLRFLLLHRNALTGAIPSELGNLNSLQYLYLHRNDLTGAIPSELGNLNSLVYLYLNNNDLSGAIPTELGDLTSLQRLWLQDNTMLSGGTALIEKIEQTDFNNLQELGLWGNDDLTGAARQASDDLGKRIDRAALGWIYDETNGNNWKNKNNWLATGSALFTFSDWYGVKTNSNGRVSELELIGNNLAGELTNAIEALHNLELIDLSSNQLSGTIPSEIGTLTNLRQLKFSYNQLTGTIPAELGNLPRMARLRLNNNLLSGAIPSEIGTLTDLWQLKLNDNRLSCDIPDLSSINGIMVELQNNRHLGGTLSANLVGNWDDRFLLDISCTGIETPDTTAFEGWLNEINLFRSGRSDCKLEVMPGCSPGVIDPMRVTGVTLVEGVEELSVSWEEFPGASGYRVQWKSGTLGFASTRQHTVTSGSTTTYTIPNLTGGTPYTIRVIAILSNNADSLPSEEETGIPFEVILPPPPGQVTGLMVEPGNAQLVVQWTAVGNATGYEVQWKSGGQGYNTSGRQATVTPGTTTSYTITSLTNSMVEYTVRVRATRAGANAGPYSAEEMGTPVEPTAPGVTVSTMALTVTEQDTTGETYTVVLDTEPTASVVVTVTGHASTDVNLTPSSGILTFTTGNWGTAQTVTVKAGNDADTTNDTVTLAHAATGSDTDYDGITIGSVVVTVEDNDTAQVTGVTVTSGNARLVVNWAAVGNATGYKVQWKSGSQSYNNTRQATITPGTTTSHTIPNLIAGTPYTIRVIAILSNNADSLPSEEETGTPKGEIGPEQQPEDLGQVTGVEVTEELRQLSVSWDRFPGASGYKVQWKSGAQDFDSTRQHTVPSGSTTSYRITGLVAGIEYTVKVTAILSNNTESEASEYMTGTPKEELQSIPGTEQRSGGGCAIGSVVPGEVSQSALFNMLVVMSTLLAASRRKIRQSWNDVNFLTTAIK